jgi:hypothetical protein
MSLDVSHLCAQKSMLLQRNRRMCASNGPSRNSTRQTEFSMAVVKASRLIDSRLSTCSVQQQNRPIIAREKPVVVVGKGML